MKQIQVMLPDMLANSGVPICGTALQ